MEEQILLAPFNRNINLKINPLELILLVIRVLKILYLRRVDALKYLDKQEKYDLILIKQTIHFFSKKKNLNRLLNLAKKRLNTKGKILIFSLKTKK